MRLVVYEWCCSGGLAGDDASAVVPSGHDVESIVPEGRAMLRALVADALRDGGFEVTVLVDAARGCGLPSGAAIVPVASGAEIHALVREARSADAVVIVAPETAGVLAARVAMVRAAGGLVLAPSDAITALAADKQATIDVLAAAGVAVPAGRSLAAGAAWPQGFRLPAVRKARTSTACDGLVVVQRDGPLPPPADQATRLEAWCAGESVGVACVIGPMGAVPLPAMTHRFAAGPGGARSYIGGELLADPAAAARAEALAVRAVRSILRRDRDAPAAGWMGVDMILGSRTDGLDDRVLEVNPRLTTSFVGLAAASSRSLVRLMVDAAAGAPVARPTFSRSPSFSLADDPSAHR
jgi:predicted ATP-grasp superfamily ATP-dependent carboligase